FRLVLSPVGPILTPHRSALAARYCELRRVRVRGGVVARTVRCAGGVSVYSMESTIAAVKPQSYSSSQGTASSRHSSLSTSYPSGVRVTPHWERISAHSSGSELMSGELRIKLSAGIV